METEHAMAGADIERKNASAEQLVADIDRTRAELARTIDEITGRLSPAHAVRRTADRVKQRAAEVDPVAVGGAVVIVAAAAVVYVLLRRRRR